MKRAESVVLPTQPPMPINAPAIEVAPGIMAETARRFFANRLAVVGLLVVGLIMAAAVFADVLAPYPRDFVAEYGVQPPSPEHVLGTDAVGRDLLSRVLHGARTSMLVGLLVPLLAGLVGVPLGATVSWRGGRLDALFLRVVEIVTAVPPYMVVIMLASIWGSGVDKLILFLAAIGWVGVARLARAQVVALQPREYVTSARALGASDWRLLTQHILPNAAGPIVVVVVMTIPAAIFAEAGLSFLGLGVKDPIPSWGKMIAEGLPYASSDALLALIPIGLIAITMLAFAFVGDGLRDAFDPHSQL